jgi:hypothetical protein
MVSGKKNLQCVSAATARRRAASFSYAVLAWASLALCSGCASRGNPQPPSLHLPAVVTDLHVERVSGEVRLRWTTPGKTSDGLLLGGPITATVCRDPAPPAAAHKAGPATCTPVAHLMVATGESTATDALPQALVEDPPARLAYRIELFNGKGRTAGPSAPAFAASGAAPGPVQSLHAKASPGGIVLSWARGPRADLATVELIRTLGEGPLLTGQARPKTTPAQPRDPSRRARSSPVPVSQPNSDPAAPIQLRARHASESDPGGLLDPAVEPHNTYVYTARRVRLVTLQGQSLELASAISSPITVSLRDVFPPASPVGVQSIASAPLNGTSSIDLSWEPNQEADLLGYNVYRTNGIGSFVRINTQPLTSADFRDLTAQPKIVYRYSVTAVDRNGNESARSAPIEESLP